MECEQLNKLIGMGVALPHSQINISAQERLH